MFLSNSTLVTIDSLYSTRAYCMVHFPPRGLLLPKIVVDDFGGTRSDPGMLGSGIYFASSSR